MQHIIVQYFCSICVICSFYKLAHGVKYLHCSELFVIGKFIIHLRLIHS